MSITIDPGSVPKRKLYNGEEIPCIGMGTFGSDRFTPEQVAGAVGGAIRCGYRLIDCAAIYGNEHLIGEVIDDTIKSGVVQRGDLCVTSKVWNDKHDAVKESLLSSLNDLKIDYIDVFFIHWPFRNYHAPGCDGDARNPNSKPFSVDEFITTWQHMESFIDEGLAKNIGMSNMTIAKLEAVLPLCRIKPALIEMELHPCFQQPELFDYCVSRGIQPIGFCPIGSPTRPDRDKAPDDVAATEMREIIEIAKARNVHPAIVCIKWAVQRGQIPIPFSVYENEYISNLQSVVNDPLTDTEMDVIKSIDKNCRLIKGQVFLWEHAKSWEDLWDLNGIIIK